MNLLRNLILELKYKHIDLQEIYKIMDGDTVKATLQYFLADDSSLRKRLAHAGSSQQNFSRAVLEAAAELSSEFTGPFWNDIVHGIVKKSKRPKGCIPHPKLPPPTSNEALKQKFVFHLNASGKYLVVREHLRQAVSHLVQQRAVTLKPSGFQTHRDFQHFLHDIYTHLVDEAHETLKRTVSGEGDPLLEPTPLQSVCGPGVPKDASSSMKDLAYEVSLRDLLFFAEEAYAQGDLPNSHRLHMKRISFSKDSSDTWLDFGLMWLCQGNDEMAELAVKEALRRSPSSVHALLVAGVLAVRNRDERGIAVISSALQMKPLCPEILVILGMVHAATGETEESDYFFRKAHTVKKVLTGQYHFDEAMALKPLFPSVVDIPTTTIEPERVVVVARYEEEEGEGAEEEEEEFDGEDASAVEQSGSSVKIPIKTPSPVAQRTNSSKPQAQNAKKSVRRSKKSKVQGNASTTTLGSPLKPEDEEEEEEEHTKSTGSGNFTVIKPPVKEPGEDKPLHRYDYIPDLGRISLKDALLPPLRPSILLPWKVSKEDAEVALKVKDSGLLLASESTISQEYEKLESTHNPKEPGDLPLDKKPSTPHAESARHSNKSPPLHHPDKKRPNSAPTSRNGTPEDEEEVVEEEEGEDEISIAVPVLLDGGEEATLTPPVDENAYKSTVYVDKKGSELIWTAQLLFQLRLFDMLDGVLTRELYLHGKRTHPVLYMRAMSLYLRKCPKDALPLVDELLKGDQENPSLWILRGHCHYEMGDFSEASKCYEIVLRLPPGEENQHLVYLRLGIMEMEGESPDLEEAKRIFLYGIQKYPTPGLWMAVGNACYAMEDLEEAEFAFAEANRLDPNNPLTWAYLSLINLALGRKALAEQSYKWAMRFGLNDDKLISEIQRLQKEKGFGDPSFPRVPNCIPYDYFVKRMGRQKPLDAYKDVLMRDIERSKKCDEVTYGQNKVDATTDPHVSNVDNTTVTDISIPPTEPSQGSLVQGSDTEGGGTSSEGQPSSAEKKPKSKSKSGRRSLEKAGGKIKDKPRSRSSESGNGGSKKGKNLSTASADKMPSP